MTGRMYPELLGKLSALIVFVGFNLTFFPQFVLGYLGMPRRYYEYPPEFQVLNVMSTAGASILAVGYVLPLVYLLLSLRYGQDAGPNPWGATGLEWQTAVAAAVHNFDETPVVTGPTLRTTTPERGRGLDGYGHCRATRSTDPARIAGAGRARPILPLVPVRRPRAAARERRTLGMWLFLATEVMFFGGLLTAYAVYRSTYPEVFSIAAASW